VPIARSKRGAHRVPGVNNRYAHTCIRLLTSFLPQYAPAFLHGVVPARNRNTCARCSGRHGTERERFVSRGARARRRKSRLSTSTFRLCAARPCFQPRTHKHGHRAHLQEPRRTCLECLKFSTANYIPASAALRACRRMGPCVPHWQSCVFRRADLSHPTSLHGTCCPYRPVAACCFGTRAQHRDPARGWWGWHPEDGP
jgi:hypothetical protein